MRKKELYNKWLEEHGRESCAGCPYFFPQRSKDTCGYRSQYCYRFILYIEEEGRQLKLF